MRSWYIFLSLLLVTLSVFTATPGFPQGREHPESILGVDTLMRNVDQHRGVVRVQGVVSAVSGKDHTLALIDTCEFQECGVTTCARLQLPVRWERTMPAEGDMVRITGEVKEINGKLIFIATTLEKASPQPKESR